MEANSNFSQGMNSDLSKFIPKKDSYIQALNFRGITELGDSTGALVNIKGNECKISYPTMRGVYKLQVYDNDGGGGNETLEITINGQTTSAITITSATKGTDLFNIISALSNCFNNPSAINPTFAVAYKDDYIIIYQQPVYTDCGPDGTSVPIVITFNDTIGNTADYTLSWIDTNNNFVSIYPGVQTAFVETTSNLITIGSTFIGEDIYLLVADDKSTTPVNDSFTDVGYIWKLSIDDITRQHTLTLLYVNYLDFTKFHPVPPSAIIGRFESEQIQRIYWSDYYNRVKTINVADPQLMALDVKLTAISPSTDFSQAILNDIITGTLNAGCYQVAYRLYQSLGSISNFSETSELIYLIDKSLTAPFQDYQGGIAGTNTSKGLQIKIDNLDTSYDQIEVVILYRAEFSANPTIGALALQPIPNTGTVVINYTGGETTTDIPVDDFLTISSSFTHAKTVDTKDNRLFWGNVRNSVKSLDDYDSRAFRAKTSGAQDIILTNSGTSSTYTLAQAEALDETEDTINEYYDSTGTPSINACYYKPNTAIIGGSGTNISYEFGTISIPADAYASIPTSDDWMINFTGPPFRTVGSGNPNVDANGNLSLNVNLYNYPQRNSIGTTKYPFNMGLLKGYQHEEIYRFGIQFFDLNGVPFFTKWIGDIKFPSYGDPNPNPDAKATSQGISDFRLSYLEGSDLLWMQIMYIKFDVDVSSLNGLISGYEIVRVERNSENNRTINGCGILTPFIEDGDTLNSNNNLYLPSNFRSNRTAFQPNGLPAIPAGFGYRLYAPFPTQGYVETLNTNASSESDNNSKFKTFDCFDHHNALYRPTFTSGDKLLIRSRLITTNYRSAGQGYWTLFNDRGFDGGGNLTPYTGQSLVPADPPYACPEAVDFAVNPWYLHNKLPHFLLKFKDDTVNYATASNNYNSDIYNLEEATIASGNTSVSLGGSTINNFGKDMPATGAGCTMAATGNPCFGGQTTVLRSTNNIFLGTTYGCLAPAFSDTGQVYKMLALYFKWNINLYGGFTYSNRTLNEYIACSEYVPVTDNRLPINTNISLVTMGGDVYSGIYDHQKTIKGEGSEFQYLEYDGGGAPVLPDGVATGSAQYSTTYFFPCTNMSNNELRDGVHINKNLTSTGWNNEDEYKYYNYQSCENNIKKYFPKPLNFNLTDQWINRVYFSEIKINNETQDNWSVYKTNNFYDVEGNYGGINCLITLNNQMYYIQDRGIGVLLINPVAMVDGGIGSDIKLGQGETIQKHQYISLDVGTKHQWSVYKSQNQFVFLDVRTKKLYSFNGQSLDPISDTKGQRNFVIKRLHNNILTNDNPIINKGVLTTYDYLHNEFLFTFLNENTNEEINSTDEFYTISYSEPMSKFVSYYSFKPNIYINNNKYLLSTNITNKNSLWLHNYGNYCKFYNTIEPSKLKLLVNDNPKYTKIFDNITWMSDSINDNIEWSDDKNIYPGAIPTPSYPDDINFKDDTFNQIRVYNDYQNSDWLTLTTDNLRRVERGFNIQIPRNKFNYDTNPNSTYSIFDPSRLTKVLFGERMRDKYLQIDLNYSNSLNNRFVIHTIETQYRISDR